LFQSKVQPIFSRALPARPPVSGFYPLYIAWNAGIPRRKPFESGGLKSGEGRYRHLSAYMQTSDLTFITNKESKNLLERFRVLIKDTRFFDVWWGILHKRLSAPASACITEKGNDRSL